ARATPRSRRRQRVHAKRAETHGSARRRTPGGETARPRGESSQFRHPRARVCSVSSTTRVEGFAPPSTRVGVCPGQGCGGLGQNGRFWDADYPSPMSARAVPLPLQQLPNVLTVGRLALIPVFVALMLSAEGGHSWPAGIVFGVAG